MLMTIEAKGVERKIQIVARHLVFGDPPDHGTEGASHRHTSDPELISAVLSVRSLERVPPLLVGSLWLPK